MSCAAKELLALGLLGQDPGVRVCENCGQGVRLDHWQTGTGEAYKVRMRGAAFGAPSKCTSTGVLGLSASVDYQVALTQDVSESTGA